MERKAPRVCRSHRNFTPAWHLLQALALAGMLPLARGAETWIGSGAGSWSNNANWLDGSAPAAGGDPLLSVKFGSGAASSIGATQDLGVFSLNQLEFSGRAASSIQIAPGAGGSLRFAGVGPEISFGGLANVRVTSSR